MSMMMTAYRERIPFSSTYVQNVSFSVQKGPFNAKSLTSVTVTATATGTSTATTTATTAGSKWVGHSVSTKTLCGNSRRVDTTFRKHQYTMREQQKSRHNFPRQPSTPGNTHTSNLSHETLCTHFNSL